MGFRFSTSPTFSTEVTVNVPNDKGGYDKQTFTAIFTRPKESERDELRALGNVDLARKQMIGWKLTDSDTKEDVQFSPEHLEAALQITPTPLAIALAFWEALNGVRAKN